MTKSNYSPPEIFTNLDRKGCIQDGNNVPIIYHIKRHCAKKAIFTELDKIPAESMVYSKALPDRDENSLERLSEKYWWLQGEAKHLDEIRRRARHKQQQTQRRQRDRCQARRRHIHRQ
ncbi:Protein of unknown function [Cotesia congregata]|uniref:Uncharacterized protein n=1 Tax=Cotesia congregata TaxID=51543 RepID=A0A8J2MPR2_COTCN|nr:Protein of unknown function [Cotesia congregata]CAG5100579.1 Protein of unknown function [Cotesia congregata]